MVRAWELLGQAFGAGSLLPAGPGLWGLRVTGVGPLRSLPACPALLPVGTGAHSPRTDSCLLSPSQVPSCPWPQARAGPATPAASRAPPDHLLVPESAPFPCGAFSKCPAALVEMFLFRFPNSTGRKGLRVRGAQNQLSRWGVPAAGPAALGELQAEDQCAGSSLVKWTLEAGVLRSAPGETDAHDPVTWRNQRLGQA